MATKKTNPSYEFPSPMASPNLVGHAAVVRDFCDAWNGRDAHPIHPVWILSGVRGIGKATLAYHIARAVLSAETGDTADTLTGNLFGDAPQTSTNSTTGSQLLDLTLPPDSPVFQRMIDGGFGDFFIIDLAHNIDDHGRPDPDRKQISVHTVRAVIDKMQLSAMAGGWRVVIVDSLDEMTASAQNAMLKMLEEPPEHTLFLLIAHSLSDVLPTIRSRARVEKLHPLSATELREIARLLLPADNCDLPPEIIRLADGSFGRIATLKKNGGDKLYTELLNACENKQLNAADVMDTAIKIAKTPGMMGTILDAIAHFGLADLYPIATREIDDIERIHLEPEVAAFRIIMEIRKQMTTNN